MLHILLKETTVANLYGTSTGHPGWDSAQELSWKRNLTHKKDEDIILEIIQSKNMQYRPHSFVCVLWLHRNCLPCSSVILQMYISIVLISSLIKRISRVFVSLWAPPTVPNEFLELREELGYAKTRQLTEWMRKLNCVCGWKRAETERNSRFIEKNLVPTRLSL